MKVLKKVFKKLIGGGGGSGGGGGGTDLESVLVGQVSKTIAGAIKDGVKDGVKSKSKKDKKKKGESGDYDPARLDHSGKSPEDLRDELEQACCDDDRELVLSLLDAGVDIDAKVGGTEGSALFIAAEYGHKELVKTLIKRGADLNAGDEDGKNALMAACENGAGGGVVEYLLKKGFDAGARDKNGETTLIHAINGGDVENVTLLIQNGADINTANREGETPLQVARQNFKGDAGAINQTIVNLLEGMGAK